MVDGTRRTAELINDRESVPESEPRRPVDTVQRCEAGRYSVSDATSTIFPLSASKFTSFTRFPASPVGRTSIE